MNNIILAINPGSTSTKIALYKDEALLFNESIEHPQAEIERYNNLIEQIPMRKQLVIATLEKHGYKPKDLSIVMGRGGLFPPIHTGAYLVNKTMLDMILNEEISPHASNLGAVLANEVALMAGTKAYIYDAVSASEFPPIAKITGMPEIERQSLSHVLNTRAVAIKYAKSKNKNYADMNLLLVHMGGGVSLNAHKKGKIIDSTADDDGPFAPERSGSVPLMAVIELCYSGKYQKKEMQKKVRGLGGLRALVGTSDCRLIEKQIEQGNDKAKLALEAEAYQIAKAIGLLSVVLKGDCDAIILTGGLANSKFLTSRIEEQVKFIAPVVIMPGEHEMEALAFGGLRLLRGEEKAREM